MRRLFVVTGPAWPLGLRARRWLATQPTYVPLEVLVRGPQTLRRLGDAAAAGSEDELVVVSDDGAVWRDDGAWVMCLWAMRAWRPFALRFADARRRPLARRFLLSPAEGPRRPLDDHPPPPRRRAAPPRPPVSPALRRVPRTLVRGLAGALAVLLAIPAVVATVTLPFTLSDPRLLPVGLVGLAFIAAWLFLLQASARGSPDA